MKHKHESFFDLLLLLSQQHTKFSEGGYCDLLRFDLVNKNISSGKTYLMKGGHIVHDKIRLTDDITYDCNLPIFSGLELQKYGYNNVNYTSWETVEKLYEDYKTSVPSARNEYNHLVFHALHHSQLSDFDLINNPCRTQMQYLLEGFLLLSIVTGSLQWETLCNNDKYWFYSMEDKDLVICKKWFNKNKIIVED